MKKRIWLLSVFSVLIVCGMIAISYFVFQNTSSNDSLQLKVEKIDKLNENKLEFTSAYDADTTKCEIDENVTDLGFIDLDLFCELTGSTKSGYIIEKNGFSFDATIDDYFVKEVNDKVMVDLEFIAVKLGYDCEFVNSKYILTRTYASKRLMVSGDTKNIYGADAVFKYDGIKLFQYNTEFETYSALNHLYNDNVAVNNDAIYYLDDVETDITVTIKPTIYEECSTWDAQMMGLIDYKEYLEGLSQKLNDVVVAVIDSGINQSHTLFNGRIIKTYARNFNSGSVYNISDEIGHGTHVAGTIAEWTPKNVKILPLKIFDASASCWSCVYYSPLKYLNELISQGVNVNVVNCSLGALTVMSKVSGDAYKQSQLEYEQYELLEDAGVTVCVAAGNDHKNNIGNGRPNSSYAFKDLPSSFDNVITVSSIDKYRSFSSYSNYGKIDFCAPGEYIISAYNVGQRGYVSKTGTSMSAPHVATVFALLYSNPIKNYNSVEVLTECRLNACIDLGASGYDMYFGYGLIDLRYLLKNDTVAEAKEYGIKFTFIDENGQALKTNSSLGKVTFTFFDNNNDVNSYDVYSTNIYPNIVTNNDILCYYDLYNKQYKVNGWYICDNSDFTNPTQLATTTNMRLDINSLTAHDFIGQKYAGVLNYVYIMMSKRVIDVKINLIYKDVKDYVGFASFGTQIKVNYFDEDNAEQYQICTAGYLAEDQVFTFKALAETNFDFMVTCENDSVLSKIVFLDYSVRAVDTNRAQSYKYSSTGTKQISVYNDNDTISILLFVLI